MEGTTRRENIFCELSNSTEPIKGAFLAKKYMVSRQVIVQDIALLRAQGKSIISTSEGYMVYKIKEDTVKRVYSIKHTNDDIEDELTTIVDLGGNILNVIVSHPIYGEISIDMMIDSRKKVEDFINRIQNDDFVPLMTLTKGNHYHTVEAYDIKILDEIERALLEKGYLINDFDYDNL